MPRVEDTNGKRTTNFWGYPKEGIAVSNNVLPARGKPRFQATVFAGGEEPIELVVRIKD